jgi:hypothetical membrane protein
MEPVDSSLGRSAAWFAWAGVAGVIVFDVGWLIAEAVQSGGYSVTRHDVSDLTALTAQHTWVALTTIGIAGVLVIAFALGGLRPALRIPGRRDAMSAWLLAASLMGLDNLSDAFFRLDCRAADPGCTPGVAMDSWHGTVHVVVGAIAAIATVGFLFTLPPRMRRIGGWQDLARPMLATAWVFVALLVAYVAREGRAGGGLLQRALIVILSIVVIVLALRVRRLARRPGEVPRGTRERGTLSA